MAMALAKLWSGKTLKKVEILSGRYVKKPPTGLDMFEASLPAKIVGVGVHGKFSYAILENETFAWFTMGMTGSFTKEQTKHSRAKFSFDDFDTYYTDIRNFGTIKFVRGKHRMIEKLESLGHDLIAEDMDNDEFILRMQAKSKWHLCKALMDQTIIAGIGNYIKADALWLARLSPKRLVGDCSDSELINLKDCVRRVMLESFNSGGKNNTKFLIYGKSEDTDGNPVIREETKDGRTTHWCPAIQS
jgi:formamidopyrimidine-DNA glycosylase